MTAPRSTFLAAVATASACLSGCGPIGGRTAVAPPGPPAGATRRPYPSVTASGPPAAPALGPSTGRGSDVNAVALAGVKAIEQADTKLDADPNDTAKRAAAWLSPPFTAQVRAYPPVSAPGATWNEWAAHQAYIVVTVSLAGDDHAADSSTTASRQVIAELHPIGRDGWRGAVRTETVFVTLSAAGGRWRLASAKSG